MSEKELDKFHIITQVVEKKIKQKQAALILNLSDRQVRNLIYRYKMEGKKAFISKKRGKISNRCYSTDYKQKIMSLVNENYSDFGPTLANEKLLECHKLKVSTETLRKWMIEHNLWISKKSKTILHPLRPRRNCFGELIQIDASIHLWFENRNGKHALIVFIDDATSKITSAFFCKTECLEGYFEALRSHLLKYGKPRAIYSDRHQIFGGSEHSHKAQFVRALKELNIDHFLAQTPQAKGRVERVNQTLQDRLVKEMRLRNINNIDDANHFLPEFIDHLNNKFSKKPRGQIDAHRPLELGSNLDIILTRVEVRTLSKELSFSFNSRYYQILEPSLIKKLKKAKIEIRLKFDGTFKVYFQNKELKYIPINEYIEESKFLEFNKITLAKERGGHPKADHPWKKYAFQLPLSSKIKQYEAML